VNKLFFSFSASFNFSTFKSIISKKLPKNLLYHFHSKLKCNIFVFFTFFRSSFFYFCPFVDLVSRLSFFTSKFVLNRIKMLTMLTFNLFLFSETLFFLPTLLLKLLALSENLTDQVKLKYKLLKEITRC